MTTFDVHAQLAAARALELQREARDAHLAALVRCCRPSTWQRAAHAVADRVRAAVQPGSAECCA